MSKELTILPEFEALCRPLAGDERAALVKSLRAERCRDPIVVWKGKNLILDGHNRYVICRENGIAYDVVELELPDREAAMDWIVKNQIAKRNVSDEHKSEMRGKRYNAEKAPHGGIREASASAKHLKTAQRLAALYGVGASTIRSDAEYASGLERIHALDPSLRLRLLAGGTGIKRSAVAKIAKLADKEIPAAVKAIQGVVVQGPAKPKVARTAPRRIAPTYAASKVKLLVGSTDGSLLEPGSVDLVLTHALVDADLASLGRFAKRALKTTGSLLVRVDQRRLSEALTTLSASMTYRWTVAVVKAGAATASMDGSVKTRWSPMLWFAKDECQVSNVEDLLDAKGGGGLTPAERQLATLVERFSAVDGVVCDPWAIDLSTIGLAARLGRQAIGLVSNAKRLTSLSKRLNIDLQPAKGTKSAEVRALVVAARS